MQEGEGSRAGSAHTRVCCVVCTLTHMAVQACGCACACVLCGVCERVLCVRGPVLCSGRPQPIPSLVRWPVQSWQMCPLRTPHVQGGDGRMLVVLGLCPSL